MLTCAVHVSDIWKWRTNAQSVRARARKHGRDPRWARREGRHQLVAAAFRPGCQRVSATCGGLPATHQLAHYKSSQKCHLNQWPFGNNATRQNSICKTTGLFYVHGFFFLVFFTFALPVFFFTKTVSVLTCRAWNNMKNVQFELFVLQVVHDIHFDISWYYMLHGLHNAKVLCWDFVWRIKRFNKPASIQDVAWWHLIVPNSIKSNEVWWNLSDMFVLCLTQ